MHALITRKTQKTVLPKNVETEDFEIADDVTFSFCLKDYDEETKTLALSLFIFLPTRTNIEDIEIEFERLPLAEIPKEGRGIDVDSLLEDLIESEASTFEEACCIALEKLLAQEAKIAISQIGGVLTFTVTIGEYKEEAYENIVGPELEGLGNFSKID